MKIIGIYPGRFQPAHRGHLGVYKKLKQISGVDTFVATSDKTPTPESPLNFGEKQQIWVRHGVPSSNITRVANTYAPVEITQNFMANTTSAVYALGGKDVERFGARKAKDEKTGKILWMKADGKTPSYFQPYKGNENTMESFDKHGYVMVIEDIKIDGKKISGTTIRDALGGNKYTPEQKKKFFQWAMGWYDPSLYEMMVDRFGEAQKAGQAPVTQPKPNPVPRTISKNSLKNVVAEILQEFATAYPQAQDVGKPTDPSTDNSAASRAQTAAQDKQNATDSKRQAERDLDALQKDLKWKQSDVIKKRKDDIPNKRKEIDAYNKTISGVSNPSMASTSTSTGTSY